MPKIKKCNLSGAPDYDLLIIFPAVIKVDLANYSLCIFPRTYFRKLYSRNEKGNLVVSKEFPFRRNVSQKTN